ncbi:MAG: YigZ family protein [Rhodothermales bacterium]|nr:YigZ family protein [Rhodothermales bacterium]
MKDIYVTVKSRGSAEVKVRGSRFLGVAVAVTSESDVQDTLHSVRKSYHDARHHCFGYRLGASASIFRSNDDGEPGGTAGPPILQQIEARDLTNTLVVVTRYFGGTKLGRGGLARAYGDAAGFALDDAGTIEHTILRSHRVRFDYDDTARAMRVIEAMGGRVVKADYLNSTSLVVEVRASASDTFQARFVEELAGRGEIRVLDERDDEAESRFD